MLWWAGYHTRELGPVSLPPVHALTLNGDSVEDFSNSVLLGGFDLRAQAELGVWRRLIDEARPGVFCWTVFILDSEKGHETARSITPRSRWDSTAIAEFDLTWVDLVRPDRPERSFAGVVRAGIIDPLMVGVPTEEAWDRFCLAIRSAIP